MGTEDVMEEEDDEEEEEEEEEKEEEEEGQWRDTVRVNMLSDSIA